MVAAIFDRLPGKRLAGEVFTHNGELVVNTVASGFFWDHDNGWWNQPTAWYEVRTNAANGVYVLRIELLTEADDRESDTLKFLERQLHALVDGKTWVETESGTPVKVNGWRILRKPGHSHPEFVWLSDGDEYDPADLAEKSTWDATQLWDQCEAEYQAARSERAHAQRVADNEAFDALKR